MVRNSVRLQYTHLKSDPQPDSHTSIPPSTDASFLTWLSDRVTSIKSGTTSFDIPQPAAPIVSAATEPVSTRQPRGDSGNRLLSHALAPIASDQRTGPSGQKRGLSPAAYDGGNKRRSTGLPSGPKAMRDDDEDVSMNDDLIDGRRGTRNEGSRSLMERIGEPGLPNGSVVDTTGATRPLRNMRGRGGPRMGMMNRGELALMMSACFLESLQIACIFPGAPPHMGRMTPMEMQMQAQFLAMQRQQMAGMHRGGGFPMAPMGGGMIDPMAMQGMFMQQQEQMQQMQAMMEQMAQAVQNGGGMSQVSACTRHGQLSTSEEVALSVNSQSDPNHPLRNPHKKSVNTPSPLVEVLHRRQRAGKQLRFPTSRCLRIFASSASDAPTYDVNSVTRVLPQRRAVALY